MDLGIFYAIGLGLIFVGIIVIIVAIILVSFRSSTKERVKGAGVIMIGPIPIIFGTDKKSVKTILVLAITLIAALIIAMLVYYWLLR